MLSAVKQYGDFFILYENIDIKPNVLYNYSKLRRRMLYMNKYKLNTPSLIVLIVQIIGWACLAWYMWSSWTYEPDINSPPVMSSEEIEAYEQGYIDGHYDGYNGIDPEY